MDEQNTELDLERDAALLKAKSQLRRYYRWKYGELPPKSWQADHQVEQNPRFASRFGDLYVHNISNLIYVPADVNAAKNRRYFHPWPSLPEKYRRAFRPLVVRQEGETASGQAEEDSVKSFFAVAGIRDGLEMIIEFLPDDEAFLFLQEFSTDALLDIVDRRSRGLWVKEPPEWLLTEPQWLDRLRDEIVNHGTYALEFEAYEEQKALEREFEVEPWTEGDEERMFYHSSE